MVLVTRAVGSIILAAATHMCYVAAVYAAYMNDEEQLREQYHSLRCVMHRRV